MKVKPSCTVGENVKWCSCCGTLAAPQNLDRIAVSSSNSTPGGRRRGTQRVESKDLNRRVHGHVHSNIITDSSQRAGAAQGPISSRSDEQCSLSYRVVFSLRKGGTLSQAAPGMKLDIMLSEIRHQAHRVAGPIVETVEWGWGWGRGECVL